MTARRAQAENMSVSADVSVAAFQAARHTSRGYIEDESIDLVESLHVARRGVTARRGLTDVDDKPRHLSVVPARELIEIERDDQVVAPTALKRLRTDEDTVMLKRIVPPTILVQVPEVKRSRRVRRVVAPLSVAAIISATAYAGVSGNLAVANEKADAPSAPISAPVSAGSSVADGEVSDSVIEELTVDKVVAVSNSAAVSAADAARQAEADLLAEAQRQAQIAKTTVSTPKGTVSAPAGSTGYAYPLLAGYELTSPYGYRTSPISGGGELHDGLDMAIACGTPVYASKAGVVVSAQWDGGFGWRIMVAHADGITTGYAHLSAMNVTAGQIVAQGEQIGAVGSTGYSTGCHLHFMGQTSGGTFDPAVILGS